MKILQLSNKIPFIKKDGGALAMFNLLDGFVKMGYKVDILSMNTTRHFINETDLQRLIPENVKFCSVKVNNNINIFKLIFNLFLSKKPYNLTRFISSSFKNKLKSLLINNNYDIIQLEGLYLCPYINTIRKYSNALIAYRAHNIESVIWKNNANYESNIVKRTYLNILYKRLMNYEKRIINRYDLLLPITEIDKEFFNRNGNEKLSCVIPFGVDVNDYIFQNNKNKDNFSLFYIGSLDWIPNIEGIKWFIDKVWARLSEKFPELDFIIAGRNASNQLIQYFNKNKIKFLGEVNDSSQIFLENNIMTVPLFAGSGMRVKIVEGMAYGRLVISTGKGVEGIECDDYKNVMIANSSEEFIKKISEVIKKEVSYESITLDARNLVEEKYNNKEINEKLVSFYLKQLS